MIPGRIIRYTFLVVLAYVFFVSFSIVATTLQDGIRYLRDQKNTLGLDFNAGFQEKLERLKSAKIETDLSNHLWRLQKQKAPTEFEMPLKNTNDPKDTVPEFDPRRTIAAYMHYLAHSPVPTEGLPFHWSDWVDMSPLRDKFGQNNKCDIFGLSDQEVSGSMNIRQIGDFCYAEDNELGFRISRASGQNKPSNHRVIGHVHLFTEFPPPQKLIFLFEDRQVQHKVSPAMGLANSVLRNGMLDTITGDRDVVQQYSAYAKILGVGTKINVAESIELKPEDFDTDSQKEADNYKETFPQYAANIRQSLAMDDPPKHFFESSLLASATDNWQGEHYDWRFFSDLIVGQSAQTIVLHRLLKNWLHFTHQNGIRTWVAHGSLLSWHWNGMLFPWDTDADVQMPMADLYRLAREFNQSLVVERVATADGEFDGLGRYFIDVSSSLTHRKKGNGRNNIDARFIDVDTGLYIDITGLALSSTDPPPKYSSKKQDNVLAYNKQEHLYNCRNDHFVRLEEVSPLRAGVMEGQLAYFPNNYRDLLGAEYGVPALTAWNYGNYYFDDNLRTWIYTQDVLDYLADKEAFVDDINMQAILKVKRVVGELERFRLKSLRMRDYIYLLTDDKIFEDYMVSKGATLLHEQARGDEAYVAKLAKNGEIGRSLRGDLFVDRKMRRY